VIAVNGMTVKPLVNPQGYLVYTPASHVLIPRATRAKRR
jgi:hypothetical protein